VKRWSVGGMHVTVLGQAIYEHRLWIAAPSVEEALKIAKRQGITAPVVDFVAMYKEKAK